MVSKAVSVRLTNVGGADAEHDSSAALVAEFESTLFHITHDLRASMRAFKTIPDWIRDDLEQAGVECPDAVRESLDLLKTQGQLADQLLVDLLAYSRVGRRSEPPAWQDLSARIHDALSAANVPDGFVVRTSLKIARVFLPENELVTLLSELVHNAWWHHGANHGAVDISSVPMQTPDGRFWVKISVADDGQGVPPEHQGRIFDMLTRLRPADEHPGSGLGLATARKIAVHLGGSLTIDKDRPSGARFDAMFPHPSPQS